MQDVKRQDDNTQAQDVKPAGQQGVRRQYDDTSIDVCRMQNGSTMTSAGTQDDGVSNDAGRTSDESQTDVRWTSDVRRVELSRRCGDGGRRRYIAAPRNATTMAENVAARSVVAALAGNALQLAAFFRRCCSNALDVATLLRWPATGWTSQRCCDG